MYCIVVYDIKVKRIKKVHNLLKQYLNWTQNSTFEGELTQGQLNKLKLEIHKLISPLEDSVVFYKLRTEIELERDYIGLDKSKWMSNII